MSDRNLNQVPAESKPTDSTVSSYDNGYEHSWQHYAAVRRVVEEAETEREAVFGPDEDRSAVDHAVDALLPAKAS